MNFKKLGKLAAVLCIILIPSAAFAEKTPDYTTYKFTAADGSKNHGLLRDGGSSNIDATVITNLPFVDSGNTTGKGNNASLSGCSGGDESSPDGWYELTLATDATVTTWTTCVSTGISTYDTRLAIMDSGLNVLVCNDDDPDCTGSNSYQSRISDYPLAAGTYYIVVDGYDGDAGPYELNVTSIDSDGCGSDQTNPVLVATMPFTHRSITSAACNNINLACNPDAGSNDFWFQYQTTLPVNMDAWTSCDSIFGSSTISILGTDLTELYCDSNDPSCATGAAKLEDALLGPGTYFIVVETSNEMDLFELNLDVTTAPMAPELLPDIFVRESDLYDNAISTSVVPGRTHLRLSNGTANIGDGLLYLAGTGITNPDGTENIKQRIFRTDDTYYDRVSGAFLYHPTHNHIHVDDWCQYTLREVLPGDGVGDVVAQGEKTSFCIVDLGVYDDTLPNYGPSQFTTCGTRTQGLTVGWIDVYGKHLDGQWIDITDVPDGTYWLESTADPNDIVLELDETNNTARVKVVIGSGSATAPDFYEPNETTAAVDARPAGQVNSPNLGPVNPSVTISSLTVHVSGNDDIYKFYANETGSAGDQVRIDFDNSEGNLDLELLDASGSVVATSASSGDAEIISLGGRAEGYYYARVVGSGGAQSPDYSITINPPSNAAPSVDAVNPPAGQYVGTHGVDNYNVTWAASDPENDDMWVSVYVNTTPALDGNEFMLPQSLHTPAALGFHVLNSAELDPDTEYYVYVEVTDGGTTTGEWADGTVYFADNVIGVETAQLSQLQPAYPNPFNPVTTLTLNLATDTDVTWAIYDVKGRRIHTVHSGFLTSGQHARIWNGVDTNGSPVASGIYFQVVRTRDFKQSNKLVLLK